MSYMGPDPADVETCDVCGHPILLTALSVHEACWNAPVTPLQKEIAKVLAPYKRTEPVAEVETLILSHFPHLANVTEEQFTTARQADWVKLSIEIMLAANQVRDGVAV